MRAVIPPRLSFTQTWGLGTDLHGGRLDIMVNLSDTRNNHITILELLLGGTGTTMLKRTGLIIMLIRSVAAQFERAL